MTADGYKALMVLTTLLRQKTLFTSKSKDNIEELASGKVGKYKNYLPKAKQSKEEYLKATQIIKAQIGKQLYLDSLWETAK